MNATVIPQPSTPDESLTGEAGSLVEALGSAAAQVSLGALAELVGMRRPASFEDLRAFLVRFRTQFLEPLELPTIREAYGFASRGQVRELLELDRSLKPRYGHSAFAEASRHVGRTELRRLRPLQDRTLQRYLAAVESGEATGWHVVVFGLLLALFSLPLRQGLAHYAARTQESLLNSAALDLEVPTGALDELAREASARSELMLQQILPRSELRVV